MGQLDGENIYDMNIRKYNSFKQVADGLATKLLGVMEQNQPYRIKLHHATNDKATLYISRGLHIWSGSASSL